MTTDTPEIARNLAAFYTAALARLAERVRERGWTTRSRS
jgi:hypothetical protein